jgi:hypothetical protein
MISDEEALSWSQRYSGRESSGPRFVPYRTGDGSFVRYDKSSDFLGPGEQARNAVAPDVRVAPLTTRARTSLGTG